MTIINIIKGYSHSSNSNTLSKSSKEVKIGIVVMSSSSRGRAVGEAPMVTSVFVSYKFKKCMAINSYFYTINTYT